MSLLLYYNYRLVTANVAHLQAQRFAVVKGAYGSVPKFICGLPLTSRYTRGCS